MDQGPAGEFAVAADGLSAFIAYLNELSDCHELSCCESHDCAVLLPVRMAVLQLLH